MSLVDLSDVSLSLGGRPILVDANLQVHRGERIGLLGRNGEGKTTLLRLLAGELNPDAGSVSRSSGLRTAYLPQRVPDGLKGTIRDVVGEGAKAGSDQAHSVERICSLLDLDPNLDWTPLSGGEKRRVLLGRALVSDPDVLVLDEPTNHLDVRSIEWLESHLMKFGGSLVFVTHDRTFLQALATRILDLDRGVLTSFDCGYSQYLERKEAFLESQEREWSEFDKTLAKEEAWIRRGLKARRTRNEGRVRALKKLRSERQARRERQSVARMQVDQAPRSGNDVLRARGIGFEYGDRTLIDDLTVTVTRGDKIGIIGPNGSGKTTLVRILLGELAPSRGEVLQGTSLAVTYFDQHRAQLDEDLSVAENVAAGQEFVTIGGKRKHVMGYMQEFLFSSERAREPVRSLSGGERNRLLLARLFTKPANVLVLDEPTNDLDTETLELLESLLVEFDGTVLVVSHDRAFLDNLCTSTLVFEGDGVVREHAGGYSDWKRVADRRSEQKTAQNTDRSKTGRDQRREAKRAADSSARKKLSFNEKREWEALPGQIETLEAELESLHAEMADPEFFKADPDRIKTASERAKDLPALIEQAYARWEELEERA